MSKNTIDPIGFLIITILLILLSYAGYLAYISIDWKVLDRLEAQPITIPTPVVASPSGAIK